MLGITKSKPQPVDPPEVREALDASSGALRSYVVQVVAFADAGGAQEAKTAEALLEPLAAWGMSGSAMEEQPAVPVVPTA
ncbi:MAG: hypothetical protein CVU63_15100 [Deltaproteobacteria bacterium HGW-Deltaproteobacteria-20]|nr:MAG: hypothetical protein CVU63_15100 [Deltaproteobacteria bacterium HGW-Deltaproteobacteria-20]